MRLFNGLWAIYLKKIAPLDYAGRVRCAPTRHLLTSLGNPDFHQGKYTEESPISQGFVRCNRTPNRKVLLRQWLVGEGAKATDFLRLPVVAPDLRAPRRGFRHGPYLNEFVFRYNRSFYHHVSFETLLG